MADPLTPDEGEEATGVKEDFIGRVDLSEMGGVNCDCEYCEQGRENADFEREDDKKVVDHPLEIVPLSEYEKNQRNFSFTVGTNYESKWMLLIGHLTAIHGNLRNDHGIESAGDLLEFMDGRIYKWKEVDFSSDEEFTYPGTDVTVNFGEMGGGSDFTWNPMLLPVEEITDDDKLAELGETEDTGEVEEVDLDDMA